MIQVITIFFLHFFAEMIIANWNIWDMGYGPGVTIRLMSARPFFILMWNFTTIKWFHITYRYLYFHNSPLKWKNCPALTITYVFIGTGVDLMWNCCDTTLRMQMTPPGQWFTILDNLIDILLFLVSWVRQMCQPHDYPLNYHPGLKC